MNATFPVARAPRRHPDTSARLFAERDLNAFLLNALQLEHPEWVQADGDCPHCQDYAAKLFPSRGPTWAQDSLREVLRTMSATIVEAASVSLPLSSTQVDEGSILARDDLRMILLRSSRALLGEFNKPDLLQA